MQRDVREVKEQYRAARRKKAGQKQTRHSQAKPSRRLRRKNLLAVFAILLVALVLATLVVALYLSEKGAQQTEPGTGDTKGPVVSAAPLPQQPAGAEEQAAPAEQTLPLPVEPVVVPVLEAPAGGWPEKQFTEQEVAALDEMFAAWAESTPAAASSSDVSAPEEQSEEAAPAPEAGHRVSVYFRDLDSGAEYVYNGGEKFDVASLSKAPYAMYLYTLVEQGQASLDETFLIDANSIVGSEENSGRLKDDPNLPRELTLAEMIEYLLRYSDTVAQRVLLERYPASGFAAYAAGLGLHYPEDVRGVTSGVISAVDAGVYLAALKEYMDSGTYGEQLRTHLMSTTNPMLRSASPLARKYGWDETAYHDMAVVYAPHPYLIAVLTDKSGGYWEDLNYFATIPQAFEQVMANHWAEVELGPNIKRGIE